MSTHYERYDFVQQYNFPVPHAIDGFKIQFFEIIEGDKDADDVILVRFDRILNGNYHLLSKVTGEAASVLNEYEERAKNLVKTQPSGKKLPLLLAAIEDFEVIYPPQTTRNTDPEIITASPYKKAVWSEEKGIWEYEEIKWKLS